MSGMDLFLRMVVFEKFSKGGGKNTCENQQQRKILCSKEVFKKLC